MVTAPYESKILVWDVKSQTLKVIAFITTFDSSAWYLLMKRADNVTYV